MKITTRDRLVGAERIFFWENGDASSGVARILKAADAGSGSRH
jgi:hypothetical protein